MPFGAAFFIKERMTDSLKKIQDEYFNNTKLVEITDAAEIEKFLLSKTSSCWGAGSKIGNDWVMLFSPSRQTIKEQMVISVCLTTNVPVHMAHHIKD